MSERSCARRRSRGTYGWRRLRAMGSRRWCMTCARGGRRVTYGWRRKSWTGRRQWQAGRGKRPRSIDINIYVRRYILTESLGRDGQKKQVLRFAQDDKSLKMVQA